jgi:hypothetical protein
MGSAAHAESHSGGRSFRRGARVIQLPLGRVSGRSGPEENTDEATQSGAVIIPAESPTGITLSDIPGEWASITTVWTGTPPALSDLVQNLRAVDAADPAAVAVGIWQVVVIVPRAALHLASWALAHPARAAVLGTTLLIIYLTL